MAEKSQKAPRRPVKRRTLTPEEKARRLELKRAATKLGEQERVVFKETARLTDELTKIRAIEEERLRREQASAQKKQDALVQITSQLDEFPSENPTPSGEPSAEGPLSEKNIENLDSTEPKPDSATTAPEAPKAEEFKAAYAAFIDAYKDKPVDFVRNVLGADPLPWQEDFLRALAAGERRLSVRAGHGVGKSTVCSWAMIWFMLTRYPQKTVCTAPTAGQLFDALFSELKFWINKLPAVLRDTIEAFSDRIVLKSSPEGSFISARTSSADRPEALAGIHSENVLLICDEASAIPEQVYESAAGSMSGHSASTVLIGNPTRNSGLFFLSHHRLSGEWKTFHVPCTANPLVSEDFVRQISTTYGETSNAFRVRVLGEFALKEDDTLIPAELIDSAMSRDVVPDPNTGLIYGLDVARFGDDRTVLVKRRGNVMAEIKSWNGADLMETVGKVMADWRIDKPEIVCVDSIGLGAGVADRLRELGVNVRDVNVSEVAAFNPQAAKLRDELWLTTRDWLATRAVHIPKHDELRQELVAPTYTFLSNGKLKVEGKGDMKKRGMRSPDLADALCLTFAGEAALIGGRASSWVKGQPLKRSIKGII
ncbi:terminase large subunit domain-containing protein [Rhizobium favelukesii]|uniref:Terminase B protein n=1 Tax=Rhizobium favelukesii TaxID=348824 RepID=W6RSX9_9HYPH|nr:terminase family protein [Rhizobium favelukesii]MCS0459312.1 terminase family protein [Rhizobium favelukesii]CDM57386.1 Terminase B protein [Rhizobium favelukesii]